MAPVYGGQWPEVRDQLNAVTITFTAGYPTVSEGIKHAMKLLIKAWFDNRGEQLSQPGTVPFGVEALLDSYRWGSYV